MFTHQYVWFTRVKLTPVTLRKRLDYIRALMQSSECGGCGKSHVLEVTAVRTEPPGRAKNLEQLCEITCTCQNRPTSTGRKRKIVA